VVVAFFIFPSDLASTDIKVPNVVGLPYDEASSALQQVGLVAAKGEQRYVAGAPAGQVVGQSPAPDIKASKGVRVTLELSRGQRTVEVPQLVGVTRPEAERALEQQGLGVGDVIEAPSIEARGKVLSTTPAAGTRVPQPSPVGLTVSMGPSQVSIPDVTGQSYADARALLVQLGFQVTRGDEPANGRPPGQVVSQTPAAGQTVSAGTVVRLSVTAAENAP
jgi:serine/threonine-protein kinase